MKIAKIDLIPLEIPFTHGAKSSSWGGAGHLGAKASILIVRVETDTGVVGYGEAFSYVCRPAVAAAVEHMVAPLALGADARDITGLSRRLQQALHLWGRYGIAIFAISGLDIALWDIAGKVADLPLHRLLGGTARNRIPGYASLYHYGDPEGVSHRARSAVDQGYRWIKLHETGEREVKAARDAVGPDIALMLDTNCPWTPAQARENARALGAYDLFWLEEPIFPPEDFAALARLQREVGIPLAAGENACTSFEFQKMLAANAVTYAQPSVTKVGGVTEFLKVAALVPAHGATLMPHSPYFGPGFAATLQLMAAIPGSGLFERLHVDLEASLYGDLVDADEGDFRVPEGPGLGADPDADVMRDYRVES